MTPGAPSAAAGLPALATLDDEGLLAICAAVEAPPWRANQVRRAALRHGATDLGAVTVLPRALRQALEGRLRVQTLALVAERTSDRGLTSRLLLRAGDGEQVEAVAMTYAASPGRRARRTVCVSTQVGCAIGCAFCATGQLGLRRQLDAAEIVDQVRWAADRWHRLGLDAPTHVVFMGMGEPLQNLDATVAAIRALARLGIGPRRIVVSTSGVVPAIDGLAASGLGVRLALSLHATRDSLRDRLVPLNRRWPIAAVMAAATRYAKVSGRRLTLEYVLIAGVNDADADADRLRRVAGAARAHVNVIPMNRIPGSHWHAPTPAATRRFAARVGERASLRFSRGDRAQAACGQLHAELAAEPGRLARLQQRVADLDRASAAPVIRSPLSSGQGVKPDRR